MSDESRGSNEGDFQLTLVDLGSDIQEPVRRKKRELELRELSTWARRQVRHIAENQNDNRKSLNLLLAQTVKLGEEVGELYAEILGGARLQRESKSARFSDETMRGEIADVLICVAILADLLDVDLTEATRAKMKTVDGRWAEKRRQA